MKNRIVIQKITPLEYLKIIFGKGQLIIFQNNKINGGSFI